MVQVEMPHRKIVCIASVYCVLACFNNGLPPR